MKNRECLDCNKDISYSHHNRIRCASCAFKKVIRPTSSMSRSQINETKKLIGKMSAKDIAKEIGVSITNLKRAFRGTSLTYYNYCVAKPDLVKRVNKYYETHKLNETAKHFGLKPKQVDHIVYRYKLHRPKIIQWTDSQIIEAAKMAGLISPKAQAKYFSRPNAYTGSIKSLWVKKIKGAPCSINGLVHWHSRILIRNVGGAKVYLKPIGITKKGKPVQFRRIILWVDLEKYLRPEAPDFIREGVKTMADFQRWIWKSDNPKPLILKMIKEREL